MKHKTLIILMTFVFVLPVGRLDGGFVKAQAIDPVLASMITLYSNKANAELKQQEYVMGLETTGHLWITEEVKATTDLQREFNGYLDDFHCIILYAAQVYGFYHEVDRMLNNFKGFSDQLSAHPSNALAVALSSNRNKIFREFIMSSVDIVNDIRLACLSGSKMTEKERIELIMGIRPKLSLLNKKIQRLIKAVKYTTLADVWAEIDFRSRGEADKSSIVRECMERWKRNGTR